METEKQLGTPDKKPETKTRREQFMLYAPLVIWIGVILFLGSGQGSMSRTSIIIRPLLEFLFPTAPEETLQFYHGIIRKLAHFTEYGILAWLAARAFVRSSFGLVRERAFLASLFLVVVVASIDEYSQSFQASRTSSPYDAMLDTVGGLVVLFLFFLVRRRRSHSRQ